MHFDDVKKIFSIIDLNETEVKILEKLDGKPPTNKNIIDASMALIREGIYKKYPLAKPEIVESLLLLLSIKYDKISEDLESQDNLIKLHQTNKAKDLFDEVLLDNFVDSLVNRFNESRKQYIHETLEIAALIEQTLARLYS
jgi:hypothetical protein